MQTQLGLALSMYSVYLHTTANTLLQNALHFLHVPHKPVYNRLWITKHHAPLWTAEKRL